MAFQRVGMMAAAAVTLLSAVPGAHASDPVPLGTTDSYLEAKKLIDEQRVAGKAFNDWLAQPAQRASRVDSRDDNDNETSGEARATLKDSFPLEVGALEWAGTELAQDDAYKRFVNDYVAQVVVDGRRQLIQSDLPLRAEGDDGEKHPVDLTLQPAQDGFEPKNALVDVTLPKRLDDGVTMGVDGGRVSLTPIDAAGADPAVLVNDDAALYANTSTDTDFIASPVAVGIETFLQLRSPASPEVSRLRVSTAGPVELIKLHDGAIEVRSDDAVIGRIAPAWAKDAQGKSIPVEMDVDGDTIVLTTKHRDRDVAYPILVDPILENWFNDGAAGGSWFRGNPAGLEQWMYAENPAGWYPHGTSCQGGIDCGLGGSSGSGLYIYSYVNAPYVGGHYAEWFYRPFEYASRTTYIPRAEFAYVSNNWRGGAANFYLWLAIVGANPGDVTGSATVGQAINAYSTVIGGVNGNTSNTSLGKAAVFAALPSATTHPASGTYYAGGAIIGLDDTESPSMSVSHSAAVPTGWVRDYSDTASYSSSDGGLGVKAFWTFVDGNLVYQSAQPSQLNSGVACTGTNAAPCSTSRASNYSYTAQTLGDGAHTLRSCAYDPTGKNNCWSWNVNVDRSAPTITSYGGDLADSFGTNIDPTTSETFTFTTTDALSGASATMMAGIDNVLQSGSSSSCSGGTCTYTVTFPASQMAGLSVGAHTIAVRGYDNVGNYVQEENQFFVGTCPTSPDPSEADVVGTSCSPDYSPITADPSVGTDTPTDVDGFRAGGGVLPAVINLLQDAGSDARRAFGLKAAGSSVSMDDIRVEDNPQWTSGGTAPKYFAVYHERANGHNTLKLATSNDLKTWAYKCDLASDAAFGDFKRVDGDTWLLLYERFQDAGPGNQTSMLAFRDYASTNALMNCTNRSLLRVKPFGEYNNQGTPDLRSVTWGGTIGTSTIRFGFHFLERTKEDSKHRRFYLDKQAVGVLSPSPNLLFAAGYPKPLTSIDDTLTKKGYTLPGVGLIKYKGKHGQRSQFKYGSKTYTIYEVNREKYQDNDPPEAYPKWSLMLFDSNMHYQPVIPNVGAQGQAQCFGIPRVSIVRDPANPSAKVLVVSTYIFTNFGCAGTTSPGSMLYWNQI